MADQPPEATSPETEAPSPPSRAPFPQWTRLTLYGLLLVAGLLRLDGLGAKSLWVDEACGLIWNQDSMELINQRCRETHTAPLREYYLHAVWALPRGMIEAASRLPSALAGMTAVPLMFLLGRRLFGWETGLFAALFVLAHPWLLLHSQDNRMHVLTFLFSLVILGLLWRLLREKHRLLLWAALGGLLALFGWFSFLAGMVYLAVAGLIAIEGVARLARKERRPEIGRLLAGSAIAAAVFLVLYAPMLKIAFQVGRHYVTSRVSDPSDPSEPSDPTAPTAPPPVPASPAPPPFHFPYKTELNRAYVKDFLFEFGGQEPVAAAFALFLAAVGLLVLAVKRRRELWIPLCWFLAPLPILLLTGAGHFLPPRYLLYCMTVYALLVGLGASALFQLLRRGLLQATGRRAALAAALAGALVIGPALLPHCRGLVRYYRLEKQNWRDAMKYLEDRAADGDRVLVGDHWAIYGMKMYRNRQLKKRLQIMPERLSLGSFAEAVFTADNVWYIYWAQLPSYIQRITDATMEEIQTFPGMLGDVRILRKKTYPRPAFVPTSKLNP